MMVPLSTDKDMIQRIIQRLLDNFGLIFTVFWFKKKSKISLGSQEVN